MEDNSDEYALARRASNGDRDALGVLIERLRLWLFTVAYTELGHYEDAQDAVASALLRICRHIRNLRDPRRLRAWMQAIVRHEASRLRSRPVTTARTPDLTEAGMINAFDNQASLRLDVRDALRRLPHDQARAMALFYAGGVSVREIARRTGRPEGTVKSWLHHGRRQLARSLKEYAPMIPTPWTATIIRSDPAPDVLQALSDALRAAGFQRVQVLHDYRQIARPFITGEGDVREYHLPTVLQGTHLLILDEWIEGHSVFELFSILRATVEIKDMASCVLLERKDEDAQNASVLAAWASGFDLCLVKPVNPEEFQRFAERLRAGMEAGP